MAKDRRGDAAGAPLPTGSCSAPPTSPAPSRASRTRSSRRPRSAPTHADGGARRHPDPRRDARPPAGRRDRRVHRRHPGRRHRRPHAVPRRPAPPPGPRARAPPRARRRPRRPAGRARRRRAVLRAGPCGPRWTRWASTAVRARCSWRCSSTAGTASCRSGPTTSARTCRRRATSRSSVLLEETDGRDGVALRRAPGARGPTGDAGPSVRHLLSVGRPRCRRRHRAARHRRPAAAGPAGPRGAQAADAARPHRDHDVLRELHPHPGVVRGRGQVDERRHGERQRVGLVGGKGESLRDTALTLAAIGRRLRDRAPPRLRRRAPAGAWVGATGPARRATARPPSSTRATAPTSTPRRRCSTRRRCATGSAASPGKRVGIVGDVLHSRVARSNVFLLATLGAEVVLVAPPTLLPVGVAAVAVPGGRRPGGRAARPGRGDDAAGAGRADARGVLPLVAGVRGGLRAVRAARRRCCPSTPSCCTPGRWCAAWRSRRPWRTRRRAAVLQQVRNGVHVRMAVLYHLLAGAAAWTRPAVHADLLIRGARPYGEGEPVDVLVARRGGRGDRAGPSGTDGARPSTPAGSCCCPASSTCTPTCASPAARSPRPSRRARPPRRSAATPPCSRCPTPIRSPTPPSSSSTCAAAARRSGSSTCTRSAPSPSGCAASGWPSSARWPARRAQVRMFSDDGRCVHDPLIMRRALEYATALDVVIAQHAEDHRLTAGAQAHEGEVASRLGLAGWPATAEETIVARDCALAREAGARLHVCHVSGAHTIAVLRAAKAAGVRVTAEVTPHHLLLTDARAGRLRPGAQGQPAAAHRRRHRGHAGRAGRGRDRRRGDRPRPARRAVQGHRVGRGPPGHAGAADGAVGGGARHASSRGCSTGAGSPA